MSIYQTKYVLVYTPPEERDFFSYLDKLKYEETIKTTDNYFQNVKVVNFDLIHHVCRGDPLEEDAWGHFAIQNRDFNQYPKNEKQQVFGGALRNQKKNQAAHFC